MNAAADSAPECPKCGAELLRPRVTPRMGGFPALLTFQCGACGEVTTVEVESPDDDEKSD